MTMPPRILLFPGMGATSDMHVPLRRHMPSVILCDWPSHHGCDSFAALAQRCITAYRIRSSDIVAGSSMGGMIACEITKQLQNPRTILIGSCHHPRSIPWRRWSHLGSAIASNAAIRLIGAKGHVSLLARMMQTVGPSFIRWSLRALHEWPGVDVHAIPSLHAIHGCLDPIIPLYAVRPDVRILLGGHFIALSHPRIVGHFLSASSRPATG